MKKNSQVSGERYQSGQTKNLTALIGLIFLQKKSILFCLILARLLKHILHPAFSRQEQNCKAASLHFCNKKTGIDK